MFWHKNNQTPLWLWVFGFIALIIILATVILVSSIAKNGLKTNGSANFENAKDLVKEIKEINVSANYQSIISQLAQQLSGAKTVTEIYQEVEEVFFSVRVPEGKRDAHLQVLVKINKLKDGGEKNLEVVRKSVSELIAGLLK